MRTKRELKSVPMITRHLDTLLRAIDLCQEAGPPVVLALPPNGRIQLAVAHLLSAAAEVSAALDWRASDERPFYGQAISSFEVAEAPSMFPLPAKNLE